MFSAISVLEKNSRPRRHVLAIQASILESLPDEGATVNKIMITANLNRQVTIVRIRRLIADGYVRTVDGSRRRTTYTKTEKGKHWLKDYHDLVGKSEPDRHRQDNDF